MLYWYLYLKNLMEREEGQDLVEYALLLGLISLVCVVALTAAGVSVSGIWTKVSTALGLAAAAVP